MKHFVTHEFDSPDEKGSGVNMQKSTLEMLDKAREKASIPFVITSGFRTVSRNILVGGVSDSSHTKGCAVDIACRDSVNRYLIINAAIYAGFNRIGISSKFIHLDNDPDKPKNVIWTY